MAGHDFTDMNSSREENASPPAGHSIPQQQHYQSHTQPHEIPPFQSQLDYLSQQQQPQSYGQHAQQPFDMAFLAGALPQVARDYPDPSNSMYSNMQYAPQRTAQFINPATLVGAQQQHYLGAQFGSMPNNLQSMQRPQPYQMQQHVQYPPVDSYGYGVSPTQFPLMDPRYGSQFSVPGMPTDLSQFARRPSTDNAPIPSFPRGPPRKPKQSGHALWVGNLPPAAQVTDLKDHFSRDATNDIESVFLIAKSNCAFVNYRSEAACVAAMTRFHDSRFHGVRLVCRLRRGAAAPSSSTPVKDSLSPSPAGTLAVTPESASTPNATSPGIAPSDELLGPTIARSRSHNSAVAASPSRTEIDQSPASDTKVPEKFFIVKSLTAQDLEASVRNGIWATQSHNEETLNRAYEQADNVYLIFSANKSGEYFGYARMTSKIDGEAVRMAETPASASGGGQEDAAFAVDSSVSPQSIPTPATATAPRGRIIDDSARGTIFWEAENTEESEGSQEDVTSSQTGAAGSRAGQNWGRQFQIEWISTNRLPFYRTRGLRNPWNASREVKIARDGTELEPGVGRKLIGMFARGSGASQAQGSAPASVGQQQAMMGMPTIMGVQPGIMGVYR